MLEDGRLADSRLAAAEVGESPRLPPLTYVLFDHIAHLIIPQVERKVREIVAEKRPSSIDFLLEYPAPNAPLKNQHEREFNRLLTVSQGEWDNFVGNAIQGAKSFGGEEQRDVQIMLARFIGMCRQLKFDTGLAVRLKLIDVVGGEHYREIHKIFAARDSLESFLEGRSSRTQKIESDWLRRELLQLTGSYLAIFGKSDDRGYSHSALRGDVNTPCAE